MLKNLRNQVNSPGTEKSFPCNPCGSYQPHCISNKSNKLTEGLRSSNLLGDISAPGLWPHHIQRERPHPTPHFSVGCLWAGLRSSCQSIEGTRK